MLIIPSNYVYIQHIYDLFHNIYNANYHFLSYELSLHYFSVAFISKFCSHLSRKHAEVNLVHTCSTQTLVVIIWFFRFWKKRKKLYSYLSAYLEWSNSLLQANYLSIKLYRLSCSVRKSRSLDEHYQNSNLSSILMHPVACHIDRSIYIRVHQ
jgi:hypothetical protein